MILYFQCVVLAVMVAAFAGFGSASVIPFPYGLPGYPYAGYPYVGYPYAAPITQFASVPAYYAPAGISYAKQVSSKC